MEKNDVFSKFTSLVLPEKDALKSIYKSSQLPMVFDFFIQNASLYVFGSFIAAFLFSFLLPSTELSFSRFLFSLVFSFSVSVISALSIIGFIVRKSREIEREISFELPLFIEYSSSCIASGLSVSEIFKAVLDSEQFSQISKEIQKLKNFEEIYGSNQTALEKSMKHNRNQDLRDVFSLLISLKPKNQKDVLKGLSRKLLDFDLSEKNSSERQMYFSSLYFSFTSFIFISYLYQISANSGFESVHTLLVILFMLNFSFLTVQDLEVSV